MSTYDGKYLIAALNALATQWEKDARSMIETSDSVLVIKIANNTLRRAAALRQVIAQCQPVEEAVSAHEEHLRNLCSIRATVLTGEERSAMAADMDRAIAAFAALSAQPSPGGQGDARAIIEEFIQCATLGRPHGKLIAQAKDYLAARQPVGEPVAVIENGAFGGGGLLWIGPMPPIGTKLYAAPPAQAVDLGSLYLDIATLRDMREHMAAGTLSLNDWKSFGTAALDAILALIDQTTSNKE